MRKMRSCPDQALQIDINRYISFLDQKPNILEKIDADNSEEEIIERPIYLSFVSPQSQSITTGYFAEAFSYTQGITPSKAVELLHSTIIDEFRKNEQLKHHKTLEKLSISLDRFYETYKNKVIKLEDIKAVIIQAIPTQLHHQATRIANKIINKLNGESHLICPNDCLGYANSISHFNRSS
ncbi:hypothetical protein [Glaesserella parasuis]|uniref:hypothetical protein n=2 Tax=Glaesserella parasuis TaxID=738 RepID=UPI00136EFE9C|nr:hypothetical protein [Glaesserella parasuis]MDG6284055.1 hypothetical protein [Glaesserella parasuis]MDO9939087.1 hypothetical protein [Glaesserella parasuis]MDO9951864.1 hypothetical protein [Glaesserella parasuis]MDP0005010.1 hypothetical protein [Glaesserella parasuis]MDP0023991.1 hypothetical protein [Glaesserella parasuis]